MQIIKDLGQSTMLCDFIPSLLTPYGDEAGLFTIILRGQWAIRAYFKGKTGQEKCRK
jgi:hypothetical protein